MTCKTSQLVEVVEPMGSVFWEVEQRPHLIYRSTTLLPLSPYPARGFWSNYL